MLSMNGLKVGKYIPNSTIKTDPLTSSYTIQNNIGRGKFAVVKKCIHNETKEVVAAKFIKKRRKGKTCREEILREVVMLEQALAHPRLVDLLEVYESPQELILVTEYCAGGELFQECVIEESFREHDVIRFLIQILEGLTYLHERNIVHLDLKPQNILLTEPFPGGDIKICDLGFACLVNAGEDIRDIIGTPDYVAPEVLDYEPLGTPTDMWSMGALTYVMLTACSPFAGDTNQETFCNISQVKLDFPESLFGHISLAAQDFMKKLLVKDPRKRLTARQCLEHEWLKANVIAAEVPSVPSPSDAAFAISQDLGSTVNYHSRRASIPEVLAKPPETCESPVITPPCPAENKLADAELEVFQEEVCNNSDAVCVDKSDCKRKDLSMETSDELDPSNSNHTQSQKSIETDPSDSLTKEYPRPTVRTDFSFVKTLTLKIENKNKRHSMEIPIKKHKCNDMEVNDTGFCSENFLVFSNNGNTNDEDMNNGECAGHFPCCNNTTANSTTAKLCVHNVENDNMKERGESSDIDSSTYICLEKCSESVV